MPKHIVQSNNRPPALRLPQARVLRALLPNDHNDPPSEWPLLTKTALGIRAGYSAISGSVTRALNGIKEGSSSGDPHKGLLDMKLCEVVVINVEGLQEDNYRITREGIRALFQFILDGGKLPPVREPSVHTNHRYSN